MGSCCCSGVVAIHHTQWIDRILIKIGPESEAGYDGPEEKDAAALQRDEAREIVMLANHLLRIVDQRVAARSNSTAATLNCRSPR